MTDWISGDVVANSIKLHYYRTGGGGPPLVLCHGITDNGLCWTRVAGALQEDYELFMVDARGHGLSEATGTGYRPEERAADLAGFIRVLGLPRPFLLGHSMGADTVAVTAATYPELAGCAILEDPPWNHELDIAPDREAHVADWRARLLARKENSLAELIAAGREQHPGWAESEFGPWAQAKLQVSPAALQVIAGLGPYWPDIAAKIACPTLLVTAEPELGALVSPEVAAALARQNPRFKIAHIPGAGHNIHREGFEPFIEAVRAFLEQVQV